MKLSEALKLQKTIMAELKNTQNIMIANNSHRVDTDIDMLALSEQQLLNREAMIALKLAIREATPAHIVENIFKLSELKEDLKCFSRMSTKEGIFIEDEIPVMYEVYNDKSSIDSKIKELKIEIASIEKMLEDFNSTTDIQISNVLFANKIFNPKN